MPPLAAVLMLLNWALLLVLMAAFGDFTALVASEKGYSGGWWFVWGALTGPIALLAVVGLPDRKDRES